MGKYKIIAPDPLRRSSAQIFTIMTVAILLIFNKIAHAEQCSTVLGHGISDARAHQIKKIWDIYPHLRQESDQLRDMWNGVTISERKIKIDGTEQDSGYGTFCCICQTTTRIRQSITIKTSHS